MKAGVGEYLWIDAQWKCHLI